MFIKKIVIGLCLVIAAPLLAILEEQDTLVKSPIPGRVKAVFLKEVGMSFKKGDPLFVIEVMKMENTIRAPKDGIVGILFVQEGGMVQANQSLLDCAAKKEEPGLKDTFFGAPPLQKTVVSIQDKPLADSVLNTNAFHEDAVNNNQQIEKIPLQDPQDAEHHKDILDAVIHPHDPGGPGGGPVADVPLIQKLPLSHPQPFLAMPELDAQMHQERVLAAPTRSTSEGLALEQKTVFLESPSPVWDAPTPLTLQVPQGIEAQPVPLDESPHLQEVPMTPHVLNLEVLEQAPLLNENALPIDQEIPLQMSRQALENGQEQPVLNQEKVMPEIIKQEIVQVCEIMQAPLGVEALRASLEGAPLAQEIPQETPLARQMFNPALFEHASTLNETPSPIHRVMVPDVSGQVLENDLAEPVLSPERVNVYTPQAVHSLRLVEVSQEPVSSIENALMSHPYKRALMPESAFLEILDGGVVAANLELPLKSIKKDVSSQSMSFFKEKGVDSKSVSLMSSRPVFVQDAFEPPLWRGGNGGVAEQNKSAHSKGASVFFHKVTAPTPFYQGGDGATLRAAHQHVILFTSQEVDEMKDVLAQSWRSLKDLGSTPLGLLCLALAGLLAMLPSPVGVDWRMISRSLRVSYTLMKASSALPALKSVRIPLHVMNG